MNTKDTQDTKAAATVEDIGQQIEALRADLMKLASTISGDVSDSIEKTGRQIGQTGRDAQTTATDAVREHPLAAVALAAGFGMLLGLIFRKG